MSTINTRAYEAYCVCQLKAYFMITSAEAPFKKARQLTDTINNNYKASALHNRKIAITGLSEISILSELNGGLIYYIDCRDSELSFDTNKFTKELALIKGNVIPTLFCPWEKQGDIDLQLLTFSGIAISQELGGMPQKGLIVNGSGFKMKFIDIHKEIDKVSATIKSILKLKVAPTRIAINHCNICEYTLFTSESENPSAK